MSAHEAPVILLEGTCQLPEADHPALVAVGRLLATELPQAIFRTGNALGEKLRSVAARRQVLCVTHLPQVAAQGENHYLVNKLVRNRRTSTTISPIEGRPRVEEIARMLGGRDLTSVTLRHAREMLVKHELSTTEKGG